MIGKNGARVRFEGITDLPSDCQDCAADKSGRAFCQAHRAGRPCPYCLGRGWRVSAMSWIRCNH